MVGALGSGGGGSVARAAIRFAAVPLLALALVVSLLGQVPALARAEPASWCPSANPTAETEPAASALARQCAVPVEVASARSFTERAFAQPDGTFTLRSYTRPQWVPDDHGGWVDVDPSFVRGQDGEIATAAAVLDTAVSPGGVGPLARAVDQHGRSLRISWPGELPEPQLEGATATYQGVYEGVDLRVTAGADWFSYELVVHTREAARRAPLSSVPVGVHAEGLELVQTPDGAVVARDQYGEAVFSAGRAFMWDSSAAEPAVDLAGVRGGDVPGAEPGRIAELGMELTGATLTVAADLDFLADPATEYPVTIDPTFTASRLAWTTVGSEAYRNVTWWDDSVWPRDGGLRIGFQGWTPPGSEGYGVWRSLARFDIEVLNGATVQSASVGLTVNHTGGCDGPFPLQLWQTEPITHGAVPTSWNSTSGHWSNRLQTQQVPSANSAGNPCPVRPDQEVEFANAGLRTAVRDASSRRDSSITFGLRAGDESDLLAWMRADADSLVLEVTYSPVVAVPNGLQVDGIGCLAPAGSRVVGSVPGLLGVPLFTDESVQAGFELQTAAGAELGSWLSPAGAPGEPVGWQLDEPLPNGEYRWRMRSEDPGSSQASAWTGWCEFTVDGLLDNEPDPATGVLECPAPAGAVLESAHESVALLLADLCGEPAEVTSLRDFDTRVLAMPDGDLVAEHYTRPQWAPDGDGDWQEIDTGLVEVGQRITTAVAVSEIEVSSGGDGPLVTATDPQGGSISLLWPDPLPSPQLDGDTATYPEVFTDVDLQVTAGVDGFSYVLVVKSALAAASPELASVEVGLQADGLQVFQDAEGAIVALNAGGDVVFTAPGAYMWDSSEPEPGEPESGVMSDPDGSGDPEPVPGRVAQMPLELDGTTLIVEPDQELLTDPGVEFPVMIDPPFSGRRMHWASVHQQQGGRGWSDDSAWPRQGGMRVGRLGNWPPPSRPCGAACGLWRSAVRFNVSALSGRDIVSASVKATQTHTSGCGSYGLELWHVSSFTSGISWNQLNSRWQSRLQTRTLASSNSSCGSNRGVTFSNSSVRSRVQSAANSGASSLSFGFRSADEASINPYRRIAVGSLALEVVYNTPAQTPTGLRTDGQACVSSAPGPWLTNPRPTLSGVPRDRDGRVGAHLQIRRIGSSATHYSWSSGRNLQHNQRVNHRLPSGSRLSSGSYRWRMRSLDNHSGASASAWNQWCYFRVDVTAPTVPKVEIVGDPPQAGEPVTLRLTSSDAHSGLARFRYGINEEVQRHSVSSSGSAEITFTANASGGRNWVYVWAQDNAGNTSNRAVYDFFAARFVEATPAAAWRLDGDAVDDSGHGHELMLGGGADWQDDAALPGSRSLAFDGTGCVGTAGPVVRLDAEYTISAWVRLDDDSQRGAVMGVAGNDRLGFYLRYRVESDEWQFLIGDRDARSVSWASLRSSQPAVVGQWTHIAVRVDPAARHMQMYVDGQLSDERDIPWATWHSEGPLRVGCSSRTSGHTWDHLQGAVHHIGVWQGLLTPAQIQAAYEGDLPAGVTGDWPLRASGADTSAHARPLNMPAAANWVDDQFGRQASAMRLDGTGWAESDGPIVRTDQSFTVSAWAKLDEKDGENRLAVVSQAGDRKASFYLRYDYGHDRWHFTMPSADADEVVNWRTVRSGQPPEVGQWYHLAAVSDRAANQLRLYVNGELHDTSSGQPDPWHFDGNLLVGASGNSTSRWDQMVGTVSDVRTWRGALSDEEVAEVYGGNPAVRPLSQWLLHGAAGDSVGDLDLALAGTPFVDFEWVADRWCFPFRALGLPAAGSGYAATSGPAVVSDESFTVALWVRLDSLDQPQTVLSQGGQAQPGLQLQATPEGRWRFVMPQQDSSSAPVAVAQSPAGVAEVGQWTHLAGVFDLARGEVRLFVGGELVAVDDSVESPWHADGPTYVGVAGLAGGEVSQRLHGAVNEVIAWSSTVHPDRLRDLAMGAPGFPCF